MKNSNKKVDGILAPEEVHGTSNATYETQLSITLVILVVVGLVAVVWK